MSSINCEAGGYRWLFWEHEGWETHEIDPWLVMVEEEQEIRFPRATFYHE